MPYKPEHSAAFQAWLAKPAGARFLHLENQLINSMSAMMFGYNAVILGEQNFALSLQQSHIKKKIIVNPHITITPSICCRQDKLAIASDSIDLVYIAHSLEFTNNPHEILREAYRILRPDGHVIISMFNPFSFWGIWRQFAKLGGQVPWVANFMSLVKLKDWLALLGFDIMRVNHFGYNLPLHKANFVTELCGIEKYGQKLDLPWGAAYIVEASKRIIPVTPIRPKWSTARPELASDLVEPTV